MNIRLVYLVLIICISTNCELNTDNNWSPKNEKEISKIWQLSDISLNTQNDESTDKLLSEALDNVFLEKGLVLCLFPDGKASELSNNEYKQSTWKFINNNQKIELDYDNKFDTLTILDLVIRKDRDYLITQLEGLGKLEFLKAKDMLNDFIEDPFYPDNNKWRIKPDTLESEIDLKKRIQNYVKHTTLILKAAMERESKVVSFEFSKGIIKIFNGGIGAVKQNRIPKEWKSTFYNEEQAVIGYKLYKRYLRSTDYKGASSSNWVKGDYYILLSLYKNISEDIKKDEENE